MVLFFDEAERFCFHLQESKAASVVNPLDIAVSGIAVTMKLHSTCLTIRAPKLAGWLDALRSALRCMPIHRIAIKLHVSSTL
jgi:hypothetical protein